MIPNERMNTFENAKHAKAPKVARLGIAYGPRSLSNSERTFNVRNSEWLYLITSNWTSIPLLVGMPEPWVSPPIRRLEMSP